MEEWREVLGWPEYEVSSHGRVKSLEREREYLSPYRGGVIRHFSIVRKSVVLKAKKSGGYDQVNLYRDGKMSTHYVHQLVLKAFQGDRPEGMEACHRNGDRTNNRNDNLRWDTKKENKIDVRKHGKLKGGGNPKARFSVDDIIRIRSLYAEGKTQDAIAGIYGVRQNVISKITTRRTWGHVR